MNLKCHVNSFSIRLLLPATSEQIDLISFKINSHTEARLWNWALSHRRAMYHLVYKWFYLRSNSKIFMWNKLRHKSSLHTQEMLLLAEHFEYKFKELESFACCQEREKERQSINGLSRRTRLSIKWQNCVSCRAKFFEEKHFAKSSLTSLLVFSDNSFSSTKLSSTNAGGEQSFSSFVWIHLSMWNR